MALALSALIAFSLVLLVWNCAQIEQIKSARGQADMYRRLCEIERREIAELRAKAAAKAPKKKAPAPDPAVVKRRVMDAAGAAAADAAGRAYDELARRQA